MTTRTYTGTWNASWVRSWQGGNNSWQSGNLRTDYARQGYYGGNHNRSMIGLPQAMITALNTSANPWERIEFAIYLDQ